MTTATETPQKTPRNTYKSKYKPTWCAGCGDYSVLANLDKALGQLGRPEWEIVIVSGIGCSSRFPYFMETYGMHCAHGRALSVGSGLKLARPDLQVIVTGGDGDALAIGGNHFFHSMRRNIDLTYILMDNQIYGMTKGQTAPTSFVGFQTKSTPYGSLENPVDPVWAALTMGASFVAQTGSFDSKQLCELILAALKHKGMSFINVLSPCVTFNKEGDKDFYKSHSNYVPADHDPSDFDSALHVVLKGQREGYFPLGLIYNTERPVFDEQVDLATQRMLRGTSLEDLDKIVKSFL